MIARRLEGGGQREVFSLYPKRSFTFLLEVFDRLPNQMENRELYDCTSVVNRADRLFWCGSLLSAQLPFSQSIVNIVLSFFFSQ